MATRFENGQVCALASHVDREDDGNAIFYGTSGLILDLFGVDRVIFKNSENLLMVQVFDRRPTPPPRSTK
jgi:hypothetical protein